MDAEWEQRSAPGVARRVAMPVALAALGLIGGLVALPSSAPERGFSIEVEDDAPSPSAEEVADGDRSSGGTWTSVDGGPLAARDGAQFAAGGGYVFVWGGRETTSSAVFEDGATYDAARDTWQRIPAAPIEARLEAATVWTGEEFVVWGGAGNGRLLADGAAFDPRTQRWRLLPPAPLAARQQAQVVSAGGKVIVWGGRRNGRTRFADGAIYDPGTDRWERLPPGPLASRRDYDVSAVALDGGMFVWSSSERSAAAAFYDVRTRQWRTLSTPRFRPGSAPVFTHLAGAVLAWGESTIGDKGPLALTFTTGPDWWATVTRPTVLPDDGAALDGGPEAAVSLSSGAFFDVLAERWEPLTPPPGPAVEVTASSAWTGSQLFVWHGEAPRGADNRALLWEPPNRWRTVEAPPAPSHRNVSATWTGWLRDQQQILLFDRDVSGAGAAYTPDLGLWEALPAAPGPTREEPAIEWSGSQLLVYGGGSSSDGPGPGRVPIRPDGVAYDPAQGTWRPLPPAPFGVGSTATAATPEGLYAAGHRSASTIAVASLDAGTQAWRNLPPPPLVGPGRLDVVSTGFEVWVWRTDRDGDGAGAAWDPVHRRWRRLPPLDGLFGRATILSADRRMFLVAGDGTTMSLGYGTEGWRTHPRAPLDGAAPLLTWTGRRLVAYDPRAGALASLDPRARTWAPHTPPDLAGARDAALLHTGRHLFAFGNGRVQMLTEAD